MSIIGDKAGFSNMLIHEADSIVNQYIPNAKWIFDGMAIIQSIKPSTTYKEFFKSLLHAVTPPADSSPISIKIIMDHKIKNKYLK